MSGMTHSALDINLEIARICTNYLYEKASHEKGLFKSTMSISDIRKGQTQISNSLNKTNRSDDFDPFLVAEVLILTLRELKIPLLHEVYNDIVNTDVSDADPSICKPSIQSWIVKIPESKYKLVASLFRMLSKLSRQDDNDATITHLTYTISPPICRPITSAYMSIRHAEDLKKIRPVVKFLLEFYDDIFSNLPSPINMQSSSSQAIKLNGTNSTSIIQKDIISSTKNTTINLGRLSEASVEGDVGSPQPLNLLVPGSPPTSLSSVLNLGLRLDLDFDGSSVKGNTNTSVNQFSIYSEYDWKVFESLIFNRVNGFLGVTDVEFKSGRSRYSSSESILSNSGRLSVDMTGDNSGSTAMTLQSRPSTPQDQNDNKNSINQFDKSKANRGKRRKMVSDCKMLRSQIFDFEQDWSRRFNRVPKGNERGPMQIVYTKYRELKKEIRDLAATDIQRLVRGFISRAHNDHLFNTTFKTNRKNKLIRSSNNNNNNNNNLSSGSHQTKDSNKDRLSVSTTSSLTNDNHSMAFGAIPHEVYYKYRELLNTKRDFKRRLKKFDEDFLDKHKRAPRKADKEIIRPMYQKYHEIKNSLDELRTTIEASHGPLPDELQDEKPHSNGNISNSTSVGSTAMSIAGTDSEGEMPFDASKSKTAPADDDNIRDDLASSLITPSSSSTSSLLDNNNNSSTANEGNNGANNKSLEALHIEKKNLHAYLKVYERDFNRTHGRPVMRHEDIQPVAHEYQRYK
eukprot:gene8715-11776_t